MLYLYINMCIYIYIICIYFYCFVWFYCCIFYLGKQVTGWGIIVIIILFAWCIQELSWHRERERIFSVNGRAVPVNTRFQKYDDCLYLVYVCKVWQETVCMPADVCHTRVSQLQPSANILTTQKCSYITGLRDPLTATVKVLKLF